MKNKVFWTLNKNGDEVLRNLSEEDKSYTWDSYLSGEFDGNNYMYHEMFNNHIYDDLGCDYERYGCYIQPGDVVLDIGANIGIFAHRAESRGASKVVCFEPLTPTFGCLIKNKGSKTLTYKMAVGSENCFRNFDIHTDFTHIGGGTSNQIENRKIVHSEKAFMIDINLIFSELIEKVDFMKVDIEGGEVELLSNIKDEYLQSIRCLACEFHRINDEFEVFQENFIKRMNNLGFRSFILFLGNGDLRTLNFWKE